MSKTSKETQADDDELEISTQLFDDYSEMMLREEEDGYPDSDSDSGSELFEIRHEKEGLDTIREDCESSVFSIDIRNWREVVYVGVGDHGNHSSMEALSWTLKHWITPSTTLCLLHIFPVIRFIPSPMGRLPRTRVNISYVNLHLDQEKSKRRKHLQKFIDLSVASQVKVETMLIEGDNVAKAIVDLVKDIGISKLVVGTTKSNLSKTGSSKRKGIADRVLKDAPENCDIKIICEGKDVIYQITESASSCSSESGTPRSSREKDESRGFVPFKKLFGPRSSSPR